MTARRGGFSPLRRQETIAGYLFLLPNILGFLVFSSIPVVATFSISLLDWDLIRAPRFVGIDNYVKLLTDDAVFRKVLFNTAYYVVGTVPAGMHPEPAAGAGDERQRPRHRHLPGDLLHPGHLGLGGRRHDVALALQHRFRADQHGC